MLKNKINKLIDTITKENGKYSGNELFYIAQVLDWDNHEKREPFTLRFEKEFAKKFGVKFAIGHNSGTSTLHSCIAAAQIGAEDEIIVPAQSVLMNPLSALHHNAIPIFADLDPETFNISPDDIEKKITKNTKAIQVAHMHGLPADMDRIMQIANKYNLIVIEDSAQCVLGYYKGRLAGTIGHMHSWSFETKKHLSTGEGGMVTTDIEELGTRVRKNAGLGYKILTAGAPIKKILPEEFQDPNYKRHDVLGWNYRMNEITSALGLAQLERIEELVEKRIKCANLFLETFSDCDWIVPQRVPEGYINSYYTFTVKYLGKEQRGVTWKEFYDEYKSIGGDGFYGGVSVSYLEPAMYKKQFISSNYLPNSVNKKHLEKFIYSKGMCPNAELVQSQMMSFKTNYRDINEAKHQNNLLKKVINKFK